MKRSEDRANPMASHERNLPPTSRRAVDVRADDESTADASSESLADEGSPRTPGQASDAAKLDVGAILEARHRYRLSKRLGNGSFGLVYLAEVLPNRDDTGDALPDQVAIKVLGEGSNAHARTSLKRELAALRLIQHDRIPKLYDWNVAGPVCFVVLEYFSAGSLSDTWSFTPHLDVDQTWRLISDLLSALAAAHRQSILHLDVKPSNVLLDGNGGFVLTDFGVSHASRMSKGLLHQGQIAVGLGTHGFRAPEQASQDIRSFDLRTDLWGVGATAWAMYTGIDLNQRKDVLRAREDGCVYGLQRLSDVHLHCPPPLEEVIMGLLYIDPRQRPGGAAEVLAQVNAVASGFGMGSQSTLAARRNNTEPHEVEEVIKALVDPLWGSICRAPGFDRYFAKFEDGEVIAGVGEQGHHTHLLLQGTVRVEKVGKLQAIEDSEGVFLGAISTLAGAPRHATLRATGTVWTCIFNEAELEQFITCNPAVAVRIMRTMASRIASGPPRLSD
jgi:serine/threonine protein kinase